MRRILAVVVALGLLGCDYHIPPTGPTTVTQTVTTTISQPQPQPQPTPTPAPGGGGPTGTNRTPDR